jgi:hypothetical protein
LREFEEENPSRRISEGWEATSSEQQHGTSARNDFDRITLFRSMNNQSIQEEAVIIDSKYDCQCNNNLMKIHKIVASIFCWSLCEFEFFDFC